MNDFEKMCKRLECKKVCHYTGCINNNEYVCAKAAVYTYVNGEKNKALKIKAEAKTGDWWVFITTLLTIFTVFVSMLTLLYTIVGQNKSFWYGKIIILSLLLCFLFLCILVNKYIAVSKWRGYILVAIEEMEKEISQGVDTNYTDDISNAKCLYKTTDSRLEREERKKTSFHRKLRETLVRGFAYLVYCILMVPITLFIMKDSFNMETSIIPELIVVLGILGIIEIAFALFNLWEDTSNDKLLYAMPDVMPELQNLKIKEYEEELKKMEIDKLIQKYSLAYEQKRKRIDISSRTFVGGLLTIILPVLFTKMIESNSTITIGVAFLLVAPLFLELAIGTMISFQNESIRNTKCLEKQMQDKYICKILKEEWEVELENL